MIDIHHHLLPGFDDGAQDLETSVAMAKIAAEDGITHVVCTPHANHQYRYDLPAIEGRIAELQGRLDAEGVALKLGRGCDFHLTYENIQQAKSDPAHFSVNGLGYLLVEIPDYALPQGLTDTFYQLQLAGLTPILTHPERNPTLQGDDSRMMRWMRGGVLVQVTAGSVLGQMGRAAQKMAHRLLERRWVHFLATDAHNMTSRAPLMREAHDVVAAKYGPEYAHLLCVSNPLHAFQGKALGGGQPEPAGLYADTEPAGWWKRMFG